MSRTALKAAVEPHPSAAREKLASAIADREQAARLLRAVEDALTELRAETSETKHELRKAETEISDAEQNAIADLVSKHLGGSPKQGAATVTNAKRAADNLRESISNLDAARSQCEAKLGKARLDHHDAKHAVSIAVQGVVASETIPLVNDFWLIRNKYFTLENLFRHTLLGLGVEEMRCQTNPAIDTALINSWKLALASLEKDPDAPLPIG